MHFSGRNFERFFVVIHATALVFNEKDLYFCEFKKVISLGVALIRDSNPYIYKSFLLAKLFSQEIAFTISSKGKGPFFS